MNAQLVESKIDSLPQQSAPDPVLSMIERMASDPNFDAEKFDKLLQMQERLVKQQAEQKFAEHLNKAQAKMGRIGVNATNKHTGSKYATYAKLDAILRPIYTEEGFSLSFDTEPAGENMVGVICYVSHAAGHTRTYKAQVPSDGKSSKGSDVMTKTHAFGSGASYGMRYLLKMIFNVAVGEHDDDGNAANGGQEKESKWISIADALNHYPDYQQRLKDLHADYGHKPRDIPQSVKDAFNAANARTRPQD